MTQHTSKRGHTPKPQQPISPPDRKAAMHSEKQEHQRKGPLAPHKTA